MHSVLNSLRDRLWVNQLKRNWNLVLKWDASNHVPLLFPLLPEHHPPHITTSTSAAFTSATFTSVKRNIALNSFSCTLYSMQIFLNLTANIIILGTYSLLLNSGPWTETIKTSTFNFKHKREQGQSQASKHLILSQHQCDLPLPVCHLPVCHLPHHYSTSVLSSEMKENRKNCVQNMSIIALLLAFQSTWFDIQN